MSTQSRPGTSAMAPKSTHHPRNDKEAQGNDAYALTPCEPQSHDGSAELPCCCVECVRYPICDEARHAPFPLTWGNGVEIFVRPKTSSVGRPNVCWGGFLAAGQKTCHLAFPSANKDFGCSTCRCDLVGFDLVVARLMVSTFACWWVPDESALRGGSGSQHVAQSSP